MNADFCYHFRCLNPFMPTGCCVQQQILNAPVGINGLSGMSGAIKRWCRISCIKCLIFLKITLIEIILRNSENKKLTIGCLEVVENVHIRTYKLLVLKMFCGISTNYVEVKI